MSLVTNQENIKFYEVLPLRNMAAMQLVIEAWLDPYVISNMESHFELAEIEMRYESWHTWSRDVMPAVEYYLKTFELPQTLIELMLSFMDTISKNILEWIAITDCFILRDYDAGNECPACTAYLYLHCIRWKSNGSVDELETAKVLLQNENMTDIQKFRIMSMYCMEDLIGEISPDEFKQRYFKEMHSCEHPLQLYWSGCHFENRNFNDLIKEMLQSVETEEMEYLKSVRFSFFNIENPAALATRGPQSPFEFFFQYVNLITIRSAAYFWHRLEANKKVDMLADVVDCLTPNALWNLMSKLDGKQFNELLTKAGVDIVVHIFYDVRFESKALQIAVLCTPEMCSEIVRCLFTGDNLVEKEIKFVMKLLNSTSTEHRSYLFNRSVVWVYSLFSNFMWGKFLNEIVSLFTYQVEYEWIKEILFGIDWNYGRFERIKVRYERQFEKFFDRVLQPQDAVVVKSRL